VRETAVRRESISHQPCRNASQQHGRAEADLDGSDRARLRYSRSNHCAEGKDTVLNQQLQCDGHKDARPLDRHVRGRGYRLLSVNNLKRARFEEMFRSSAKTDISDAHRMLDLLRLQAQEALQLSIDRRDIAYLVRHAFGSRRRRNGSARTRRRWGSIFDSG
jgi:hypothetical protein